jgi:hypothetical protein
MNSGLYNRKVKLPDSLIKHLEDCFNSVSADNSVEGYNRNKELRENGIATYQQIKRIKNWFGSFSGRKEDAPFILNGGDRMNVWCDEVLNTWRNNQKSSKQHKSDAGMQNQFLSQHQKNITVGDKHNSTVDSLKVNEEIVRINKLIKEL